MEGRILTVNTGSTSTKIGFFDSGQLVFEEKVTLSAETLAKYGSVMDLETELKDAITEFLLSRGVELETIDVVMARGGLITPVVTGVYRVNKAMRDALYEGKEGVHACNLSAIIADDMASVSTSFDIKDKSGSTAETVREVSQTNMYRQWSTLKAIFYNMTMKMGPHYHFLMITTQELSLLIHFMFSVRCSQQKPKSACRVHR